MLSKKFLFIFAHSVSVLALSGIFLSTHFVIPCKAMELDGEKKTAKKRKTSFSAPQNSKRRKLSTQASMRREESCEEPNVLSSFTSSISSEEASSSDTAFDDFASSLPMKQNQEAPHQAKRMWIDDVEIIALKEKGWNDEAIANEIGCDLNEIYDCLIEFSPHLLENDDPKTASKPRKPPQKIGKKAKREMVKFKKEGLTNAEIGEKLNCSGVAVGKHLKVNAPNLVKSKPRKPQQKIGKEAKWEMVGLTKEGYTYVEIGKRFNCSDVAVRNAVKQLAPELISKPRKYRRKSK